MFSPPLSYNHIIFRWSQRLKLQKKKQQEIQRIEEQLCALEQQKKFLENELVRLSTEGVGQHNVITQLSQQATEIQDQMNSLEEKWLELSA